MQFACGWSVKIDSLALWFMKLKISKDTNLAEILKLPGVEKILVKYNLPCLSCPFAKSEMENLKIFDICKMYDIPFEKLVKELEDIDIK